MKANTAILSPDDSTPHDNRCHVAYLVSQFPKLTETFVLYELLAAEQRGIDVDLYALRLVRSNRRLMHSEAASVRNRAQGISLCSLRLLAAQFYFLRSCPGAYLTALAVLLVATWGSLRYFVGALLFFPKAVYFARQMIARRTSHLHAHFASHPAAMAFVIHRLTGIPYSFTAHGSDLHRDQHMLRQKVTEAAFVVAISQHNREVIVQHAPPEHHHKVIVLHCGVDPRVFQPGNGSCASGTNRLFSILCVGTLHEVKGQTYLIDACSLLKRRGIPFTLHLVGDGPDRRKLARQARQLGLADRVVFHGAQPREQVVKLLQQADVVVAPSVPTRNGRREGIPVALMEAMCCEVPVIASRLSGIPELVQENQTGLLVSPRDSAGLAAALEQLTHDVALRRRLARAGRRLVLQQFNLHTNSARLVQWLRAADRCRESRPWEAIDLQVQMVAGA